VAPIARPQVATCSGSACQASGVNEDRSEIVLTWKFLRARPVNQRFAPVIAHDNAALVETLELAFERIKME
jgi:hypothetical protein